MRLKELELTVEELKMRLGEYNLRDVFFACTRASTDVARLSHGIHLRGVGVNLGGHDENRPDEWIPDGSRRD